MVTDCEPPWRKVWETIDEPRLLVIGRYQMGFSVAPTGTGSRVRIWIDYRLPAGSVTPLARRGGRLVLRSLVYPADAGGHRQDLTFSRADATALKDLVRASDRLSGSRLSADAEAAAASSGERSIC